ncbi:iron ABC transporter permease [Leucobacter viscericola]|uniref:Iron ABC transporter permease n=1 Tax=Leucobacter viscericola TaxID=2714935 RepID=A0A6G7XK25_9MICO|nr:iron ABC transporter permease [Leucobacter viscericola]QIK64779.1 iron ABC transporter permease [Leucobacter viscericola]
MSPPSASPHIDRLRRSALRKSVWIGCGVAVVVVLIVASVVLGAREVSFSDVVSALQGSHDSIGEAAVAKRIPRTVLALLVGAALAMSGTVMQGVTRNPLADPGLLGVSSGASLAVVIGICFFGLAQPMSFMAVAIVGAALAAVFVYAIGSIGRSGATPLRLALAGAATSAAFISLTSAIMLPRVDLLRTFQFWIIGGVGGADWESIGAVLPLLGIGALVCILCARSLNSLALGDSLAVGLGVRVGRARLVSSLGAVILCGAATAVAGPIGFVGLVIPHLCRLLVGPDHRWLLPFSAIVGAALLLASDVLGRIVARPEEIEVGIVVALLGAPFFIWIVRRQKVREL